MSDKTADLPVLLDQDFAAYEERRQKDPEYNGFRLAVRRKLDAYGKEAVKYLKKEAKLALGCRTSLNHPHASNRNRVRSQIAYLSRTPKDKKALNAIVGPALAKDVDTNYIQTTLAIQVDSEGFEQSLRIHSGAWWDGQNLKNRVRSVAEMDEFGDLLNGLPQGFVLYMDNWRKEYVAGEVPPSELERYFRSYEPGQHWFNLRRRLSRSVAIEIMGGLAGFVREGFLGLADLYRFVCWSPENNFLFGEDGKMQGS